MPSFSLSFVFLNVRERSIFPFRRERETSLLVIWCFKPSQPQRIISGLRETFIKRYIVERTNKAEMRPEEQNEKAESCCENLWNEIQLKGP